MKAQRIIEDLAKFYDVDVRFRSNWMDHATIDLIREIIYIQKNTRASLEFVLSCFFHELAHLYCKHKGKYPLYHGDEYLLSQAQQKHFLRTMWRAEVFVDKKGAELMKLHFPGLKYHFGYTQKTKKMFYPEMKAQYGEYFDYLNKIKIKKKKR